MLASCQKPLSKKLTREFSRVELQQIVERFVDKLVEVEPDLEINSKQIAEYLANGQPEGDKRLTAIIFAGWTVSSTCVYMLW